MRFYLTDHVYKAFLRVKLRVIRQCRAYPGLEFVVANTLAKLKKLEPIEIDFSQGLSQKVVSTSCSISNSLPNSGDLCRLLIISANNLDPDQARQSSQIEKVGAN